MYLGEQRRKRGEREAQVAREGKTVTRGKKRTLPLAHDPRASRSPRFRLCSLKRRKRITPVLQTTYKEIKELARKRDLLGERKRERKDGRRACPPVLCSRPQ